VNEEERWNQARGKTERQIWHDKKIIKFEDKFFQWHICRCICFEGIFAGAYVLRMANERIPFSG
jgi:hypothetical protein